MSETMIKTFEFGSSMKFYFYQPKTFECITFPFLFPKYFSLFSLERNGKVSSISLEILKKIEIDPSVKLLIQSRCQIFLLLWNFLTYLLTIETLKSWKDIFKFRDPAGLVLNGWSSLQWGVLCYLDCYKNVWGLWRDLGPYTFLCD